MVRSGCLRTDARTAGFTAMTIEPSRHALDEEIEGVFEANPALREELDEAVREIARCEADLVDQVEARRPTVLSV